MLEYDQQVPFPISAQTKQQTFVTMNSGGNENNSKKPNDDLHFPEDILPDLKQLNEEWFQEGSQIQGDQFVPEVENLVVPSASNCSRESKVPEYSSQISSSSGDPRRLLDFASPALVPSSSGNKSWSQKGRHLSGCTVDSDQQSWSTDLDNLQPTLNESFPGEGVEFGSSSCSQPNHGKNFSNNLHQFSGHPEQALAKQEKMNLNWNETSRFGFPTAAFDVNSQGQRFTSSCPTEENWTAPHSYGSPVVHERLEQDFNQSQPYINPSNNRNPNSCTFEQSPHYRHNVMYERVAFRNDPTRNEEAWYANKTPSPQTIYDSKNHWIRTRQFDRPFKQDEPPPLAHFPNPATPGHSVPDFRSCHLADIRPDYGRAASNPGYAKQVLDEQGSHLSAPHHIVEKNQATRSNPVRIPPMTNNDSYFPNPNNDNPVESPFSYNGNSVVSNLSRHASTEDIRFHRTNPQFPIPLNDATDSQLLNAQRPRNRPLSDSFRDFDANSTPMPGTNFVSANRSTSLDHSQLPANFSPRCRFPPHLTLSRQRSAPASQIKSQSCQNRIISPQPSNITETNNSRVQSQPRSFREHIKVEPADDCGTEMGYYASFPVKANTQPCDDQVEAKQDSLLTHPPPNSGSNSGSENQSSEFNQFVVSQELKEKLEIKKEPTVSVENAKTCNEKKSEEPQTTNKERFAQPNERDPPAGYNGRRGSLPLWQFLISLLEDPANNHQVIAWTGRGLEFKLVEPEEVARRWGIQKNRPAMNYDKLSRSLRYYYEKGIMQKVAGERYVYKFVCEPEALFSMTGPFPNDRFQHPSYSARPRGFSYHPYMNPHSFHVDRNPSDSYNHMYFQRYSRSPHCHSSLSNFSLQSYPKNPNPNFPHPRIKRSNTVPLSSIHKEQTPEEKFSLYQGSCVDNPTDPSFRFRQSRQDQISFDNSL